VQRIGQQIGRGAVLLSAQHEPVDVPLGQPDRPGVVPAGPAGRTGRGGMSDGVMGLCRHGDPEPSRQ
jgi:hypothetical protein